jgi:hypothetical protein
VLHVVKFTYRKQGPSGRGAGRVRYLVDGSDGRCVPFNLGVVEGAHDDWSLDDRGQERFKNRRSASGELARRYEQKGAEWIFVLAIVKGLVEHGDPSSYFGSTIGLLDHARSAARKGMLGGAPGSRPDLHLAVEAVELYRQLGLDRLPTQYASRAYTWDWEKTLGPGWVAKLPA